MELNLGIRAHDIENQTTVEGLVEEIAGKGLTVSTTSFREIVYRH